MSNRARWILVWIAATLPLLGWWATGLFDLDEGYYAAVVGEMNRRGEWITPYFNGQPWFEKPILLYWLAKPCVMLCGQAIGPRLPSVLATIGLYGLSGWFCRRHYSETVAQLAVLVLAGSLLVVAIGRMMLTDAVLCLCLSASFLLLWESATVSSNPSARFQSSNTLRSLSGLALGLAVLAKGPVSIIFFALLIGWSIWRLPNMRPSMRSGWGGFLLAFIVIVCTWYVPALIVHGQFFVQKFFIEQNLRRFTGGDEAHTVGGLQGLIFYVPILLLGMAPWIGWLPKVIKDRQQPEKDLRFFLLSWAGLIFLFFTVSSAKLPHYVLPVIPPLAVLVAIQLKEKAIPYAIAWCLVLSLTSNGAFWWWYGESGQREAHALARYIRLNTTNEPVVLYQFTRRQSDRGTGTAKLQETSLPSLLFYLDRTVLDTDELELILRLPGHPWIMTRSGRIGPEELVKAASRGRILSEMHPSGLPLENFKLYRLE